MGIAHKGSKFVRDNNSILFTCSAPDNASGDFLLAFCNRKDEANAVLWSAPGAEWTLLDGSEFTETTGSPNKHVALFYKEASAGEPTQYIFDANVAQNAIVVVNSWSGVNTSDPLDVVFSADTHYIAFENSANQANPAITTNTDKAVVILLAGYTQENLVSASAPQSPTNIQLVTEIVSASVADYLHTQVVVGMFTATASGTYTPDPWGHTLSGLSTADPSLFTLALAPTVTAADVVATTSTGLVLVVGNAANYDIQSNATLDAIWRIGTRVTMSNDSIGFRTRF